MSRWPSNLSSALLFTGSLLALASTAHAGPVEQLVQVALHPKDPDVMVLRHEYGGEGIFITKDGGKTWSYVCNSFIDPTTQARRGVLHVAGDGALLLGVFDGVWRGDAEGCNWGLDEALAMKWVPDITQDPTDPDVLYAITSNGNPGSMNGIVRRDASGNWAELGKQEDLLLTRMRVVKNGDGRRFYQSAVKGMRMINNDPMMQLPNYIMRYSDDDGATYTEHTYESSEPSASFRLIAADPSNPDRIVAWIDRDVTSGMQDSILVSTNRGETFSEYMKLSDYGGIALAPDGRVWLAERGSTSDSDASRGLWAAANLDTQPTQSNSELSLSCLAYQPEGDVLYACQLRKFGTIDPSAGTFTDLFLFNKVESFASCGGSKPMSQICEPQMCRDYCVLGHFPETPMCAVFQTKTCGPCSAIPEAEGCMLTQTGGTGGGGGASGGGGTPGSSGIPSGGAGGASGSAGSAMQPSAGAGAGGSAMVPSAGKDGGDDEGDGGGCAVAAVSGRDAGAFGLALFAAALGLARRVRRRARPRT